MANQDKKYKLYPSVMLRKTSRLNWIKVVEIGSPGTLNKKELKNFYIYLKIEISKSKFQFLPKNRNLSKKFLIIA